MMDMLISLIVVSISQAIHIAKHQVVDLKYTLNVDKSIYLLIIPQESWKKKKRKKRVAWILRSLVSVTAPWQLDLSKCLSLNKNTRNYLKTGAESRHCSWKQSRAHEGPCCEGRRLLGSLPAWVGETLREQSPRCSRKCPWWQAVDRVQLEAQPNQTHLPTLHWQKSLPCGWEVKD